MPSRPTAPGLFPVSSAKPASISTSRDLKSGWITAHCDGGARGNPGPAGYGAEVTGPDGSVIAELSEFLGIRTNNYAEYSGLLASLQYALDHHHPRLKVISDSELMVKQIQGKYKVNSPDLKPLWQEAKNRIARLEGFEIAHALRHKNKAADALANQAMDRGMRRSPASPAGSGAVSGVPKATPYPQRSEAPANPYPAAPATPVAKADAMLRGFTRDGVVHILGGTTLPDGIFVKIIRE